MLRSSLLSALVFCFANVAILAGELPDFARVKLPGVTRTAVGVTRRDTRIEAFVSKEDTDYATRKCRILLVGGLDGERKSVDAVLEVLQWFTTHDDAGAYRELMALSAIPCGNPDGVLLDKADENGAGGKPGLGYPPTEKFYQSQTNVESQYLWNWIALHAPDVVIDVRAGKEVSWGVPKASKAKWVANIVNDVNLQPQVNVSSSTSSLVNVLAESNQPAIQVSFAKAKPTEIANRFLASQSHERIDYPGKRKLTAAYTRRQLKSQVEDFVGRTETSPKSSIYFDTLPLLAINRIADLTPGMKYVSIAAPPQSEKLPSSGSELAGILYRLDELDYSHAIDLRRGKTTDKRVAPLIAAADLAFDKDGKPLREPPFHNEMSDAVFMNGPLLSGVGSLTREKKYFDACAQHVGFIRKLCQRDDGLYRHSPLCEAAWGRGNGFVAMGMALILEDFPKGHPEHKTLLKEFQAHMAALKKHQDYSGMWHQVIDHDESYREFTATAMIGFAMARGIRGGWLEEKEYQPCVDRAWQAVVIRTMPNGEFRDVCTGTGKQKTLRDYLDREALQGRDARAGAMLLMFASERVQREANMKR